MISVTCDMCGCEIDYNLNGVNLDFNKYGTVKFKPTKANESEEYQLCNVCASKVKKFVDEKGGKNDKSRSN